MVWPAAAYIEMACAVQRRLFGGHEDRGLRDLRFTRKLVVSEGGTEAADVVRCVFEDGHFRITRDDEVHAVGRRAEDVEGIGNAKEWMAAAEVRCTRRADIEGLQRTLREGGFCYGAQFRTLKRAYVGEGEAVGVLEAPDDAGDYGLHPGLIDGAFQLTDLICRGGVPARAEYVAAPSRRRGSGPVRAYVKVVACDATSSCCDVTLLDPEHNVLLRVGALWQVVPAPPPAPRLDRALYIDEWVPAPDAVLDGDAVLVGRCIAVCAAEGAVCAALHSRYGEGYAWRTSDRLLADWAAVVPSAPDCGPTGLVVLEGLDGAEGDREVALRVVRLLQCATAELRPPAVVLVTCGAQHPGAGARPAHAALWGVARSVRAEAPALPLRLLDVAPGDPPAAVADAVVAALHGLCEHEVALRGGRPHVRRIKDFAAAPPERRAPPATLATGLVALVPHAVCLGVRDVLVAAALAPRPAQDPLRDVAGVVAAVGPGVTAMAPGDRVYGCAAFAALGFEGGDVPWRALARMPPGLSFAEAATLPTPFVTANRALDAAGVGAPRDPAPRVLVLRPTSPLGLAVGHMLRLRGGAEVVVADDAAAPVDIVVDCGARDALSGLPDRVFGVGCRVVHSATTGAQAIPARPDIAFLSPGPAAPSQYHNVLQCVSETWAALPGIARALPRRDFAAGADLAAALRYLRAASRPGPRAVLCAPAAAAPAAQAPMRTDGAYLVSGGLGGLGIVTAQWLAARGARDIALLSRDTRPRAALAREWAALTASPARVHVLRCDVTRARDVLAAIEAVRAPVRGVVHAAGAVSDAVLPNVTPAKFDGAWGAKVEGARVLRRCTVQCPLDFLVLFSSIAGALGSPGQANYAAANAQVDADARSLRANGCPAVALQWNSWAEVCLPRPLGPPSGDVPLTFEVSAWTPPGQWRGSTRGSGKGTVWGLLREVSVPTVPEHRAGGGGGSWGALTWPCGSRWGRAGPGPCMRAPPRGFEG